MVINSGRKWLGIQWIKVSLYFHLREKIVKRLHHGLSEKILVNTLTDVREYKNSLLVWWILYRCFGETLAIICKCSTRSFKQCDFPMILLLSDNRYYLTAQLPALWPLLLTEYGRQAGTDIDSNNYSQCAKLQNMVHHHYVYTFQCSF